MAKNEIKASTRGSDPHEAEDRALAVTLGLPVDKVVRYLRTVRRVGTTTAGCKAAKMSTRTAYEWKAAYPAFAEAEHQARETFYDGLEQEATRRAWHGVKRIKSFYFMGAKVGEDVTVEYSDTLMTLLLKAGRPEKYRERSDVRTDGSVEVRVVYDDLPPLPEPIEPPALPE